MSDLTLLIQQTPHVASLAQAEHNHPERQRLAMVEAVQQTVKRDEEKVQKAEKPDTAKAVGDEEREQARGQQQRKKHAAPEQEDTSSAPSHVSPFAGKIVDITV